MTEEQYHLSATIPHKSAQFLEWLARESELHGGSPLSKAAIVRALLNVAMRIDIEIEGIRSQRELEERIWVAIADKTKH